MIWQGGTIEPRAQPRVKFSQTYVPTTRLCGVFALALGAMTLTGWALGIPLLLQIRPEWAPMVVNTAIGFVLSGAGLFVATRRGRWPTRIAVVLGALVALLAVEELCVLIFDIAPALSLPNLHRPMQPHELHPGRMAPNTALCFLLFGVGLSASTFRRHESIARWVQRAALAVLSIGLLGVIGYTLQLEYLYDWAGILRMAVHTGAGMAVLGIGLWDLVRARGRALPISDGKEVAGVYRAATLLLLLVAASAGIGAFAFLQQQAEQQTQDALLDMTADRIELATQIIGSANDRVRTTNEDDDLPLRLRALVQAPQDPATLDALRAWAAPLDADGYSSLSLVADGRRWQLLGTPMQPALTVALRGDSPGWLLWKSGYVLRNALQVRDAAGKIGLLIAEQPLPALSAMVATTNRIGDSEEMDICGADAVTLHCFPMRSHPTPFNIARVVAGQPLPMDYAIRGNSGANVLFDYRQHRVLAAYGPIGDTGLGLAVKRDTAEIFAPIRQQFQHIVIFLGVLVVFGLWLMRRRLRPLLHALEDSRALAQSSSARFQAAVESNMDAFFILECMRDAAGEIHDLRYVLLNARAERILGRLRAETIGRGICELFPEYRSNGMLATYLRVVETSESLVEERSAVANSGQTRWYHLQAVKLGDGLGVTVRDITTVRHAADRIRHQAMHDPLTGLTNRAGFELALTAAIAEAQQHGHVVAVALLDLDAFKPINDSFGHAAGDKALQEVATRLRDCMRPSDIVARLGGDEFVVVLPDMHYPEGAEVVARKLIAQIARPMRVDGHDLAVTISVGISACPRDGIDAAHLLKCADTAMYQAKRAGRNGYALYDPSSVESIRIEPTPNE